MHGGGRSTAAAHHAVPLRVVEAQAWCDNAHKDGGFAATGEPGEKKSKPLEMRAGTLDIAPQKDGPLKVSGNLEVVSGTGRTVNRTSEAFFCRCGHSRNKPYCDGSHRKADFKADGE